MKKAVFFVFVLLLFACDNGGGNPNNPQGGDSSGSSGGPDNPGNNGEQEIGAHAVLPSNQNPSKVDEMYDKWINTYYVTFEDDNANPDFSPAGAPGTARIKANFDNYSNGSRTCSEAIGYGMVVTSLKEDWGRFDKLLAYSKLWRIGKDIALMRWNVDGFEVASGGSATDADIDILASLLIAYKKTNKQNYLDDAIEIGASIYEWEVESNSKLILPAQYSDYLLQKGIFYNISYFSLAAIKTLAKYDKSRDWNAVLDANLSYMEKVQNAGDGLWPDWSDPSGVPINPDNKSNQVLNASDGSTVNSYEAYYKEAVRIPWRIAWYYHWYGDAKAKAMLDKGFSFLSSKVNTSTCEGSVVDACGLKNFYSYKGGKQGTSAAGRPYSLCALGMGSSSNQEWLNTCNEKTLVGVNYAPTMSSYYSSSLQLIYAMLFNGKF